MSVPSDPRIYVRPAVFNQALEFYWQPPSSDGGSNIISYILESSNIGYISVLPESSRKARVENLNNQTSYVFTLKATNQFGNSNVTTFRSVQPGIAPDIPSNFNINIDLANSEPLLNLSLTQPDTTNSSNITYNALTMYPLDTSGNIITNSPFMFKRFSLPGMFEPVTLNDTNTNFEYKGLIQSINDVRWSKYTTFYNFKINPNLPTNGLKLWLDPYDLTTLTLSNNKVIQWNDKSINQSNAIISETFAPTYDSNNVLLNFDGSQYLNLPANTLPSGNTSYSMFIYASISNISLANSWLLFSGTPTANLSLGAKFNNGNILQSWFGTDLTGNLANFTATADLPILSSFTYDGSTRKTYINSVLINSEIANNRNSGTSNNIIGSLSTLNSNLIGSIGDIVLYDRLLNDKERTSLETYLINKRSNLSLKNYGNLTLWLDATDNNTLYNSNINEKITYHNPVSVWLDKSNNNNHAFQSNLAIAPLKKNTLDKDSLNFNSGYMISNIATLPFDAFLIVQLNNLTQINDIIGISPESNNYNSLSYNVSANRWSNDSTSNTFISSNIETSSGYVMMEYSLANNNAYIRRNGSNIANVTNFNWSLPNNSKLYIGNDNGVTFNNSLKGNIGEIIMFNKQLTDNQRFPIEGYLAWKWGIQNTLPYSHLFYNKPPSLFSFSSGSLQNGYITGGNVTTNGIYTINTFSTVGNTTCTVTGNPIIADILIVAGGGGGGGGDAAAGGGAGGLIYRTNYILSPGTYNITIGEGGIGGIDVYTRGSNGGNSVFSSLIAIGGGGGAAGGVINGLPGGSGGGAAGNGGIGGVGGIALQPTSSSGGFGFAGADGHDVAPSYGAGGGGGAASVGSMGNSSSGGNGGNGLSFNLSGSSVYYSGGGGGGSTGGTPGSGGLGGGGNGTSSGNGISAISNTGGGGGGAGLGIGGNGGSGIIIIRYVTSSIVPPVTRTLNANDIPGLQLWMDANDSSTFVLSGTTINRWDDKGYSKNSFTATTGNHTYITEGNINVVNSIPYNIMGSTFNVNYTTNSHIFLVSKKNSSTGYVIGINTIDTDRSVRYYGGVILGTNLDMGDSNDVMAKPIMANGDTTAYSSTFSTYNQVDSKFAYNDSTKFFLSSASNGRYFNGHICEILVYDSLNNNQRVAIQGYLAWKWGLQSYLPSSHLYKNSAPLASNFISLSPLNIGTTHFWIDISNTSSLTFSGTRTIGSSSYNVVTQVNDLSGNNRNLTVRSGTNGPVYFSTLNSNLVSNMSSYAPVSLGTLSEFSYPGLLFRGRHSGATDSLIASMGSNYPMTIFMVCRDWNDGCLIGSTDSSDTFWHYSGSYDVMYLPGFTSDIRSRSKSNFGWIIEGIYYSGVRGRAQVSYYLNSEQVSSDINTTSSLYYGINNMVINGRTNGETTEGTIHEIIIFNSALPVAKIKTVEGYLAWKWGLVSNLSNDHPFKNVQPSSIIDYFSFVFLSQNFSTTWSNTGNTSSFGSNYQLTPYNGITLSPDAYGSFLNFNGTNQYLQLPARFTFNFNNYEGFTYICVARFNATNNYERFFDFGNGQSNNNILFTRQSTTSSAYLEIFNNSTSFIFNQTGSGYFDTNWHIYGVSISLSASGTNVKIFRDNLNSFWVDTTTNSIPINRTTSINYIGRSNWSADSYFNGNIRYINFFNSNLSLTSLANLLSSLRTTYGIA